MTTRLPDLYAICKAHLADTSFPNETAADFIEWVRMEYLKGWPDSHQIPSGYRDSVDDELKLQIEQWLKVTLYGKSLAQARGY